MDLIQPGFVLSSHCWQLNLFIGPSTVFCCFLSLYSNFKCYCNAQ